MFAHDYPTCFQPLEGVSRSFVSYPRFEREVTNRNGHLNPGRVQRPMIGTHSQESDEN